MIFVYVTHRFVGWHSWPDAPPERAYLSDHHRHLFHVRAEIESGHADRAIEFHDLLAVVQNACGNLGVESRYGGRDLASLSCEMIADLIMRAVRANWQGSYVSIDVSEDGENGARVSTVR